MNNIEEDFLSILYKNDMDKMKKFIISNGKKPKPISPIYYIKDSEDNIEEVSKPWVKKKP